MTALPMISVVIPMRNEGSQFGDCLDGVLAQDYPPERVEVLVVDGESEDESAATVRAYAQRHSRLRVLVNPRRIVPTALNIAIRAARGDVVARVDGHTRIAPDYLRTGVDTLRRTGADNVGGPMRPTGGGWFGDAVASAMSSRFGIGAYFHYGTVEREADTVYMGMWPRTVFERVGLFDEELVRNQDDEFNYRLRKHGGRVVLNPAMRSAYQNRQSVTRLARQFYQYGEWKVRVLQKHPRQMSWRHFVPPAFVAALVVSVLTAVVVPGLALIAGAVAGAYLAMIVSVSAYWGWRSGWRVGLGTAAALVIMHVAWGAGFLVGLVRHRHHWGAREPAPPALETESAAR